MGFALVLLLELLNPFNKVFSLTIDQVLNRIQFFYQNIQTINGSFVQKVEAPDNKTKLSKGEFWIQKPKKFKWLYESPEKILFLYDGTKFFIYYIEEKYLAVFSSPKEFSFELPLELLTDSSSFHKNFKLESFKIIEKDYWKLNFVPLKKSLIEKISVIVNLHTGEIKKMILFHATGERLFLTFQNIFYNKKLPPDLFQLKVPEDIEIEIIN